MDAVDQIQSFPCVLPPGTTPSAPTVVPMQLGIWSPAWIEFDVPSGLAGAVGFYVAASGQQYIPFRVGNTPTWLGLNSVSKHYDLHNQPTSGDWSLVGYNQGNFQHIITVTWGLVLIQAAAPSVVPAALDLSALSGST